MSYITDSSTTGDNMHPLEAFFGPYRGSHESMRADEQLAHESYNLPKAYEGKNKFLESVLDFKIRKEDSFYTSSLLPWEYTDDLHIKWEIFSFNRSIADLEPHQGVPRFVSAESESRSDNLLRRGLAFMIEHGFYKTERGKRHFNMNLAQITDAVHTTAYFGVIHALLGGQEYYKDWNRRFGRQITRQGDLMARERRRWAVVQKTVNGLYLLDAEIKHEMKREGVSPNIYVFPDKMKIYVNMVGGGHQLDYDKRGPQANDNRERGELKTTFRGTSVFEAQSFDIDFSGQPLDLMIRERQCGEFFTLKSADGQNVKYIYDADADNWAKIAYADYAPYAINAADEDGRNSNGVSNEKVTGDDLILFRPHQTYRMGSAILAAGGRDLGCTYHGHHDFMLSDDIIRKIHVGHYTFYSKSVVKSPKRYAILEDVFSQGYVGGENTMAFGMSKVAERDFKDNPAKCAQAYTDARNEGTLGREGPSIVVVKTNDTSKLPDCIDITGRFHASLLERFNGNYEDVNKAHYAGSDVVYNKLQLRDVDPFRQTDNDEFLNRIQRINTVCYRGCEGKNEKGTFVVTQLNQGHWGHNVYPGCRRVRDGENTFLKDCNYQIGLKN